MKFQLLVYYLRLLTDALKALKACPQRTRLTFFRTERIILAPVVFTGIRKNYIVKHT